MRTRPLIALVATCVIAAVTGLVSASASPSSQTLDIQKPVAAPAQAATTADPCGYTAAVPADRFKGIPTFDAAKAAQPYSATLLTTQGAITFRALTDKAPCTTYSFRFLAERFYYNLTHC